MLDNPYKYFMFSMVDLILSWFFTGHVSKTKSYVPTASDLCPNNEENMNKKQLYTHRRTNVAPHQHIISF